VFGDVRCEVRKTRNVKEKTGRHLYLCSARSLARSQRNCFDWDCFVFCISRLQAVKRSYNGTMLVYCCSHDIV
jgi:hypothetical protein